MDTCVRLLRRQTLRFMDPPAVCVPALVVRRSGRAPTFSAMPTDLLVGYGWMERRPSLREQMAEQLRIEGLAEGLQDLDSPPALGSPEISPARPRKGRKGMGDLVELARRYVTLSDQLEAVRGGIARGSQRVGG
jgi:hypothetical protein